MVLFPVLLALLPLGCSSDTPDANTDGTWVGTITTDGNVTTVVNESGSVWGGTATLVEEMSVGVEAGEEPYMLASIRAIAATEDRIYLLEQRPPVVRVYDLQGNHLRDIGRQGQGPGEFTYPMSLAVDDEGQLFVRDDDARRITVFSPEGSVLTTWAYGPGAINSRQMVIATDRVYTPESIYREGVAGAQTRVTGMVPYTVDGARGEPVFDPVFEHERLTLPLARGRTPNGGIATRPAIPFYPATRVTTSPLGASVGGFNDEYRFEIRKFDGTTTIVERAIESVPISTAEAEWHERFVTAATKSVDPTWSWDGPRVPDRKPFFDELFADQSGRIWVRRSSASVHVADCDEHPEPQPRTEIRVCWVDSPIFEVFEYGGRYLGEVEMPPNIRSLGFGRAFIRDAMVLARVEDEAGTIMVKRYRLVLPGER